MLRFRDVVIKTRGRYLYNSLCNRVGRSLIQEVGGYISACEPYSRRLRQDGFDPITVHSLIINFDYTGKEIIKLWGSDRRMDLEMRFAKRNIIRYIFLKMQEMNNNNWPCFRRHRDLSQIVLRPNFFIVKKILRLIYVSFFLHHLWELDRCFGNKTRNRMKKNVDMKFQI